MALGKPSDLWKDYENHVFFKSILDLQNFTDSCSRILKSVNEYGLFDTIDPAVRYYRAYNENKTSFEEFSVKYNETNYQYTCVGVSITILEKIVQELQEEYPNISKAIYLVSSIWDSRQMSQEGFRDVSLQDDSYISLLRPHCTLALKINLNGRDGYVFLETTWFNTEAVVLMKDNLLPKRSTFDLPILDLKVSHYLQDKNIIVQFLENKAKQRFYSGSRYVKQALIKPDMIWKYYVLSYVVLTHIFLNVIRTPSFYACVLLNTKKKECKIEINERNEAKSRKMVIPPEYFVNSSIDPAIEDFLREAASKLGKDHSELKLQLTDLCISFSDDKFIRDTKIFLESIDLTTAAI